MKRNVIVLFVAAMAAMALTAPGALAHEQDAPQSQAPEAVGPKPGCAGTWRERREWAMEKAATIAEHGNGRALAVAHWRFTEICPGDNVILGGMRIPEKGAGDNLPMAVDPGVATSLVRSNKRPKPSTKRSAREHGSCTVYSSDPYVSGAYMWFGGGITCTNSTNLDIQINALRRYNSTGVLVINQTWNYAGEYASHYAGEQNGKCPSLSTYRTRFVGDRVHAGAWGGAVVDSPNAVASTSACQ